MSQDNKRGECLFSLNDSTVEDKQLELVLVKEEKEVKDNLENGFEDTKNQTPIKQEPLPWNELGSVEDVMVSYLVSKLLFLFQEVCHNSCINYLF